jgi:WD40 repeat protein
MAVVAWVISGTQVSLVRQFVGHKGLVTAVAFSPDGKLALSGGADWTVRIWEVATGRQLHSLNEHVGEISCVAFSPDGRRAASGSVDDVRIWDVEEGKQIRRLQSPTNWILHLAFSPDGQSLLSTSKADHKIRIWDVQTGKQTGELVGHDRPVEVVAFSADGGRVISCDADSVVRIWDAASRKPLKVVPGESKQKVACMAFTPDGRHAASCKTGDRSIGIRDLETGKEMEQLQGHVTPVLALAFAPDGRTLVSGSLGPERPRDENGSPVLSESRPLRLWDAAVGRESALFEGVTESVRSVAFSADGKYILSGGSGGALRLWRAP